MKHKTLWIGLACTITGAVLLTTYMDRFEEHVLGGRYASVLIVTRDLNTGARLQAEHLAEHDMPERFVESQHIESTDRDRILGTRLNRPAKAGETVRWNDIDGMRGGSRMLSQLVREGMRAMPVSIQRGSMQRLLRPGDMVDVLHSRKGRLLELHSKPTTVTLLQNVLVLAVGSNLDGDQAARRQGTGSEVTLSVTPDQSHRLAEAASSGSLHLTLRNPDDGQVVARQYGSPIKANSSSHETTRSRRND